MGDLVKQQQQIQRYYDATTLWFMSFGSTRKHGSIHRALYVDRFDVNDPTQVIHFFIKDAIMRYCPHAQSLLDVGCGVGASLDALGHLLPQLVVRSGVTLSHVQAEHATRNDLSVIVATFHALPYPDQSADVVIAIESMIHSDQPAHFWREVQRVLRPGGMVFVCDDVLCDADNAMISPFQKGWHAPNLQSQADHVYHASAMGLTFCEATDLTPYLRLVTVPMLIMHLLARSYTLFEGMPIVTSMIGSMALQQLLADNAVAYTIMVFVRP